MSSFRKKCLVAAFFSAAAAVVIFLILPVRERAEGRGWVDWSTVSDDPAEELSISWMGVPGTPNAVPGNWIERNLGKRFRVNFSPVYLDYNAYGKRKPLMFCVGDVPDVFWEGDPVQVRKNVANGFVLELPREVIARYAPDYVRAVDRYAPKAWLYGECGGRNYGVPTFAVGTASPGAALWRMDWLRAVGIDKVPESIAEMHEAFRRFTFDDPDGNGVRDTYGLSPLAHWARMFSEIFAAFGTLPFDFIERDGGVVWGGTVPEARAALAELRNWYREGIIDPDFILNNEINRLDEKKFIAGKVGYLPDGATYEMMLQPPGGAVPEAVRSNFPQAELAVGPVPVGAGGVRRGRIWGYGAHTICFGSHLAAEPEKVIRVLTILNELARDEELYLETRLGEPGRIWFRGGDGGVRFTPEYQDPRIREREGIHRNGIESAYSFYAPCALAPEKLTPYLSAEMREFRSRYARPEWGWENAIGKSDLLESATGCLHELIQMQLVMFIEIINGSRPLEDFETFRREWLAGGGEAMTAEANEKYRKIKSPELPHHVDE